MPRDPELLRLARMVLADIWFLHALDEGVAGPVADDVRDQILNAASMAFRLFWDALKAYDERASPGGVDWDLLSQAVLPYNTEDRDRTPRP